MWLDVGSDFAEQAFGSIKSLPAIRRMERKQEEEAKKTWQLIAEINDFNDTQNRVSG